MKQVEVDLTSMHRLVMAERHREQLDDVETESLLCANDGRMNRLRVGLGLGLVTGFAFDLVSFCEP